MKSFSAENLHERSSAETSVSDHCWRNLRAVGCGSIMGGNVGKIRAGCIFGPARPSGAFLTAAVLNHGKSAGCQRIELIEVAVVQVAGSELEAAAFNKFPSPVCRPRTSGACPAHPLGFHSSWPNALTPAIRFSAEQILRTEHFIQGSSPPIWGR